MISLRPYQSDLVARTRQAMQQGARRVLLQAPTGAGKTAITTHMLASAVARGKRAWFCVPRIELVRQSARAFHECANIDVGIIASGFPSTPAAPVQVCSIQTLTRRLSQLRAPDFLVVDECHHIASKSWSAVAQAISDAYHVGLSATPQRLDGRGLSPFFDALVCGPSTADLIAQGWLSPFKLFAPSRPNLDAVHRVAGDYNKAELAATMAESSVTGDALSHYTQYCPGARALVFAWNLDASRQIAQQFRDAGFSAQHVDGETPTYEREDAMTRFASGELRVVCNVDLFGEGLDVPALDAVFLLRPTQSLALYLQQVGRGLRPAEGKTHVAIFDHASNWERHGLPDDAREWSLAGGKKKAAETAMALKLCMRCFAVSRPNVKVCPHCGTPFVKQSREVERVDGTLEEANLDALRALRQRASEMGHACRSLADFQVLARELKYRPGWAFIQWEIRKGNQKRLHAI